MRSYVINSLIFGLWCLYFLLPSGKWTCSYVRRLSSNDTCSATTPLADTKT